MDLDIDAPPPPPRTLSARQERRLIAFLDERFLALMRGFKMRSQARPESVSPPSTPAPALPLGTLSAFLAAANPLLALVLQIPPGPLRTAYLLRLTHDVLGGVPGYAAPAEGIALLLDWLDDLDQGWVCALQRRAWDPVQGAGAIAAAGAVGQTERTRLRGLLLGGAAGLEEWLAQAGAGGVGTIPEEDEEDEEEDGGEEQEKGESEDVAGLLARLGLRDGFDVLFAGTLEELGELGGVGVIPPT